MDTNDSIYSDQEKKNIMNMLNTQRKERENSTNISSFSTQSKEKILDSLNRQRRDEYLFKHMSEKRISNKKVYIIHNKKFYKIKNLERDYLFKIDDYDKLSSRPKVISIFYDFLGELKKKDVLIQIRRYSDKIFISDDLIKVYYKTCHFENN